MATTMADCNRCDWIGWNYSSKPDMCPECGSTDIDFEWDEEFDYPWDGEADEE